MKLSRHKVNLTEARERTEQTRAALPTFLAGARRNPSNLNLLASNALDVVAGVSVLDPALVGAREPLTLAAQALSGLFLAADARTDHPATVPLGDGEPAVYTVPPDGSLLHALRWIDAFLVALVAREIGSIDGLCAYRPERFADSSTKTPAYVVALVQAIQAIWLRHQDAGKRLVEATRLTDPELPDIRRPDWVLRIDVPLLDMLYRMHVEPAAFDASLTWALEHHKAYWSAKASLRRDWDGFVSWRGLAMASWAFEKEVPFSVESDYLPRPLVEGTAV